MVHFTSGGRLVSQNNNKLIGMNVTKKGSTIRYNGYNSVNSNENDLEGGPAIGFLMG